jgi:hypothetical protein
MRNFVSNEKNRKDNPMGEAKRRRQAMPKPNPPVFHMPVGRHRQNGEIVPFENDEDQADAMIQWCEMTAAHPAAVAAGAFVTIGPTVTCFFDIQSRTVIQSRTADGAWQPSAMSDLGRP